MRKELKELADLSTAYLMGWKTIRDCAERLAGIDWAELSVDQQTAEVAGRLELLATEVLEGLRPEAEFRKEAVEFVERETGFWIDAEQMLTADSKMAYSSNDSIEWSPTDLAAGVS